MFIAHPIAAYLALFTLLGSDTYPGAIVSGKSEHVVILPGMFGADEDTRRLKRMLEAKNLSAQLWDWTLISLPAGTKDERRGQSKANRHRAKELATRLKEWRKDHANDKIYLVGASGGAMIAIMVCESTKEPGVHIIGRGFFEKLVLLSAPVPSDTDLTEVARKSRGGIFNYVSSQDGTLKNVKGKAAGFHGFSRKNSSLRELHWENEDKATGNYGAHLQCLTEGYCQRYVLPLFQPDQRIPRECQQRWRR